jgi:hypothetical protein
MSTPSEPINELQQLLSAVVDGELSYAQQQHLAVLLRDNPALQQQYSDYLLLDSLLRWEQPEPVAIPARRLPRWRSGLYLAGALAASGLLAVALWHLGGTTPTPNSTGETAERSDSTVAVLLRAPEAEWGETTLPTRPGAPLPPGWLRLKSGFAHIQFYNGATVILQGPAELRLISRSEAFCARGKLRATVPPQAQGFTIGSPKLNLVDRGTEFGLRVGAGETEVHVFQGKVDLFHSRPGQGHRELTTGRGIRLVGGAALQPIEPDPTAFQTAEGLTERAEAATLRRHQDWQKASEAVRKDPSLLVYYTFESSNPWSRTLLDQAGGRKHPHDGAVVGCSWVTGRWPGKQALEFKQVSDRVRLHLPGEFDSLSLLAWVRVDALPNYFSSLFMPDSWNDGGPHWHINAEGTIELGVQGHNRKGGAHYYAHDVFGPEQLGRWVHLAVVYDRDGDAVTHYIDGKAVQHEPLKFDIPLRIGDAELGNWNLASRRHNHPIRYFSGLMDEFMLFSRALSEDEIKKLYTQGRPPS